MLSMDEAIALFAEMWSVGRVQDALGYARLAAARNEEPAPGSGRYDWSELEGFGGEE